MVNSSSKRFKGSMFYEQQDAFFSKLEKFTGPLRFCAHEMVECIDKLTCRSKELNALKEAYHQLETLSVKELEHGIEAIKTEFLNVDFITDTNGTAMNNADFVMYFDKQNHFNAEVNALIKKAIEIAA